MILQQFTTHVTSCQLDASIRALIHVTVQKHEKQKGVFHRSIGRGSPEGKQNERERHRIMYFY